MSRHVMVILPDEGLSSEDLIETLAPFKSVRNEVPTQGYEYLTIWEGEIGAEHAVVFVGAPCPLDPLNEQTRRAARAVLKGDKPLQTITIGIGHERESGNLAYRVAKAIIDRVGEGVVEDDYMLYPDLDTMLAKDSFYRPRQIHTRR